MDPQESEQHELVYIRNLKNGSQKDGMKLYNEEGPNDKKPAVENRLIEGPTLNNLNHVYELYEESGCDNDNIEDFVKGENKKNSKENNRKCSKRPLSRLLAVALRMYLTLHLLLFEQSM